MKIMTEEQMVEAIYKEVANKELSFGCKIFNHWKEYIISAILININIIQYVWWWHDMLSVFKTRATDMIIWHPVMIGDVFEWTHNEQRIMNKNQEDYEGYYLLWGMSRIRTSLANIWSQPAKPIEEQSKDCKEYVYNLILWKAK